jgi:hypothetical protein
MKSRVCCGLAEGERMIVGAAGKQVLLLWDVDHTLIET